MRELEALLEYHSRLYYELDTPEIEDAESDAGRVAHRTDGAHRFGKLVFS